MGNVTIMTLAKFMLFIVTFFDNYQKLFIPTERFSFQVSELWFAAIGDTIYMDRAPAGTFPPSASTNRLLRILRVAKLNGLLRALLATATSIK